MDFTVKKGRFREEKKGQAKRASLGAVEEIMSRQVDAKALQDDLQSFGFTPGVAKPEIEKVGLETKGPLIR